jgi:hypothetical protein
MLAKAYVLSFPVNEKENFPRLIAFLMENDPGLDENSKLIKCTKFLGNSLVQSGLQNYIRENQDEARERMYNIGSGAGVDPEITERAYQDMAGSDTNLEMIDLGKELLWLADVLPPAVQGNNEPYFTTGTDSRQIIRQYLPVIAGMDSEMNALLNSVLEENRSLLFNVMEEELVIYSLMACSFQ